MNINFDDLERLIKIAERANIQALEVTDGDASISIVCQSNDQQNSTRDNHQSINDSNASSVQGQTAVSGIDNNVLNNADNIANDKNTTDKNDDNQVLASQISAPMLGTFYRRSEPTADEFIQVGDKVAQGQTLCIIEAMKMMHEVKAEAGGTIKEILVDEGDVVEYGQALFIL